MQVIIKGKNFHVSDGVKTYAEEKVAHTNRIFPEAVHRADVVFVQERNPRVKDHFSCEVIIPIEHGGLVRASASAPDPHSALDEVIPKVETQLRKIKGKTMDRHHASARDAIRSGNGPLAPIPVGGLAGTGTILPEIVRRKRFTSEVMNEEQASIRMDILGYDFFLFVSTESGKASVLYRRKNNDLGLIELD